MPLHTTDELAGLRQLLSAFESGSMSIRQNGQDVTQREISKLGPDIAYLETVLARLREGDNDA